MLNCAWCKRSSVALFRGICRPCLESLGCEDCGRQTVVTQQETRTWCAVGPTVKLTIEPRPVQLYDNGLDVYAICADCWPHRAETFGPDRQNPWNDVGSDIPGGGAA